MAWFGLTTLKRGFWELMLKKAIANFTMITVMVVIAALLGSLLCLLGIRTAGIRIQSVLAFQVSSARSSFLSLDWLDALDYAARA